MHHRVALVVLAVLVSAPGALAQSSPPQRITLKPAHQQLLDVPEVTRVAVGDPAVADVRVVEQSQLLIIGQRVGTTTLMVWKRNTPTPLSIELVVSATAPSAPGRVLSVRVGQRLTEPAASAKRVAVGDADIADVEVTGGAVVITGVKVGNTTLLVWPNAGAPQVSEVRVTP